LGSRGDGGGVGIAWWSVSRRVRKAKLVWKARLELPAEIGAGSVMDA
jgi:hypothetical protein